MSVSYSAVETLIAESRTASASSGGRGGSSSDVSRDLVAAETQVVAESCEEVAARAGVRAKPLDGIDTGWVVGDFVDVILHVFEEEPRKFYDLEHLWADAPRIDWTPERVSTPSA